MEVFNLKFTPLFVNCFLNSADVLLSKPGRISSSNSTTVTSESRSISKLANSHQIAPAPTIQTFFGGSSQFNAVSEFIMKLLSNSKLGRLLG